MMDDTLYRPPLPILYYMLDTLFSPTRAGERALRLGSIGGTKRESRLYVLYSIHILKRRLIYHAVESSSASIKKSMKSLREIKNGVIAERGVKLT
jgi:hypothetical protein